MALSTLAERTPFAEEWAYVQELLATLDEGARQLLQGNRDHPEAQAFLTDLCLARARVLASAVALLADGVLQKKRNTPIAWRMTWM